jgi:hypothetical protein
MGRPVVRCILLHCSGLMFAGMGHDEGEMKPIWSPVFVYVFDSPDEAEETKTRLEQRGGKSGELARGLAVQPFAGQGEIVHGNESW